MRRILIATSNPGKLRDFAGAAAPHGIEIAGIPNFSSLSTVVEDGLTFEENARKKAEEYSRHAPGEIVVADDSGLEVDALSSAPGVHSARYAADQPHLANENTDDEANNARVLRELRKIPPEKRTGRFICVLAAARDGQTRDVSGDGRRSDSRFAAWQQRLRIRSAILFSADSKDICRTKRRREGALQSPGRGLSAVSGVVRWARLGITTNQIQKQRTGVSALHVLVTHALHATFLDFIFPGHDNTGFFFHC
jgi:non-canonical purine NTP pyrophosphatase (RdgB/HAM1 family)